MQDGQVYKLGKSWAYRYRLPDGRRPQKGGFATKGEARGALTEVLGRIHKEYWEGPIYITENGASYSDGPGADGAVHDVRRIEYLRSHLAAIESAIDEGVPVDGYFHWSLLDNLEWLSGFSQRFGLIHVDHETMVRTPKASFEWYRDVITRNALK